MVGLLAAAATFLGDLTRAVTIPCEIDFISVSRCGDGDGIALEKDVAIAGRETATSFSSTIPSIPA